MFKSHNKRVKGMNKPPFYDWKGKTKTDFINLFFKFFLKVLNFGIKNELLRTVKSRSCTLKIENISDISLILCLSLLD